MLVSLIPDVRRDYKCLVLYIVGLYTTFVVEECQAVMPSGPTLFINIVNRGYVFTGLRCFIKFYASTSCAVEKALYRFVCCEKNSVHAKFLCNTPGNAV